MKRSINQLFSLLFVAAIAMIVSACGDDDPQIAAPIVSGPAEVSVTENETTTVTFNITVAGGFSSANVEATGGTATITAQPAVADVSGSITVDYAAGDDGAGALTLTVTDAAGNTGSTTVVMEIGDIPDTFQVTDLTETRSVGGNDVEFKQTRISGIINRDYTFTNDVAWVLSGRVIVGAGATLTIEPGTIVKGQGEQGAAASVLLVARGADIIANGTANDPIVFTSVLDNINVGEFTSTLDINNDLGLWGGVLILGNAPIVAEASEVQIEGIPTSVTEGIYGGSDPMDNSGSFTYCSIRYTGQQLGPGNELQGLTLGGVGNGTVISHVESINSADDGIEIFGGTVNISNFIVLNPDDDGFDADQGWTGTASNLVYIGAAVDAGFGSDHPFELDGPEGDTGGTAAIGTFTNATAWGRSATDFADLRDGATYTISDSYFFGFAAGVDLELDADGTTDPNDATKKLSDNPLISDNYAGDDVTFTGLEFSGVDRDGATSFTDITKILNDKLDGSLTNPDRTAQVDNNEDVKFPANNSIVSTKTKGADVSVLGWSYTAELGLLANF
ncbi:autotransporter outer membrane beta-barrel domain-containing protein [Roseivirga misakiensis]|uniref:Uncharacterized protein n=1 Tax=Roseivirga misakiensis TaxID=1563681 RepID=A0A1E5T6K2_9BACT|nr:hypothetical protein [Roseivirga misakiensis]OEK07024.1 hypothetical protein BFP71_05035 [Roseivirga misakiensis]